MCKKSQHLSILVFWPISKLVTSIWQYFFLKVATHIQKPISNRDYSQGQQDKWLERTSCTLVPSLTFFGLLKWGSVSQPMNLLRKETFKLEKRPWRYYYIVFIHSRLFLFFMWKAMKFIKGRCCWPLNKIRKMDFIPELYSSVIRMLTL